MFDFTTVCFKFYSVLGATTHKNCSKRGRKGQVIMVLEQKKVKRGLGTLPYGN